jgi:hypothetical protein
MFPCPANERDCFISKIDDYWRWVEADCRPKLRGVPDNVPPEVTDEKKENWAIPIRAIEGEY